MSNEPKELSALSAKLIEMMNREETPYKHSILVHKNKIHKRPSWDEYFLTIAKVVSIRSTCKRRAVGCVLVNKDHDILSTGYNGKATDLTNCNFHYTDEHNNIIYPNECAGANSPSGSNLSGCEALHAEWNALIRCKDTREIDTCYTTTSPCSICTGLLLGTKCRRIVYIEDYPHQDARERWIKSSRIIEQVSIDEILRRL